MGHSVEDSRMNAQCAIGIHDYEKVYPDQDLIDGIIFEQPIEEIWVCRRCRKAKQVVGTVGYLKGD